MGNSSTTQYGVRKDFEIIWVDRFTQQMRDLLDVTIEIYHYEEATAGAIKAIRPEPYLITETINDTVNVASCYEISGTGFVIDKHFTLQLDIAANQLAALDCAPNDFLVLGTSSKISIINGYKVYALSACELASLINLDASGYTACAEGGFVVLKSNFTGSTSYIEIGNGTFDCPTGFPIGTRGYGTDLKIVHDLLPTPMTWMSTGRYAYPAVHIVEPYRVGERYYVLYYGFDPSDSTPEHAEEDFMVVDYNRDHNLITYFVG